jgi:hypothetical protein
MQRKTEAFNRLYHSDQWVDDHVAKASEFDYSGIDALAKFEGTHPAAMQKRIDKINWKFDHDLKIRRLPWKYKLKMFVEKCTGYRIFEYKNYKLLK